MPNRPAISRPIELPHAVEPDQLGESIDRPCVGGDMRDLSHGVTEELERHHGPAEGRQDQREERKKFAGLLGVAERGPDEHAGSGPDEAETDDDQCRPEGIAPSHPKEQRRGDDDEQRLEQRDEEACQRPGDDRPG